MSSGIVSPAAIGDMTTCTTAVSQSGEDRTSHQVLLLAVAAVGRRRLHQTAEFDAHNLYTAVDVNVTIMVRRSPRGNGIPQSGSEHTQACDLVRHSRLRRVENPRLDGMCKRMQAHVAASESQGILSTTLCKVMLMLRRPAI